MPADPRSVSRRDALAAAGRAVAALAVASLASPVGELDAAVARRLRAPHAAARLRVIVAASDADAVAGAQLGAVEGGRAASLVGRSLDVRTIATGGPRDALARALARALAAAPADAVVGGSDAAECRALAEAAARAGAVYVDAWSADDGIRTRALRAFHVAASDAQRRDALVRTLPDDALARPWTLLGGAAGAAHARALLAARGATVAGHVGVDAAAGARRGSTGGTALLVVDSDAATLAAGARWARETSPAVVAAASPLDARLPHVHAALWDASLERYGGEQLNARYRARTGREMGDAAWAGWASLKLLADAWLRPDTRTLAAALAGPRPFDANKGRALAFRAADGQLVQPLYVVRVSADGRRAVIGEAVPGAAPSSAAGRA